MFVEFMLLETHIYDLPFSYMGMTGLFLCAGYRWNCEENWQEGCTCWEYKCLVNLSPAYTKHALIFHVLSIILATQTLNPFKGCIFQKKMILVSWHESWWRPANEVVELQEWKLVWMETCMNVRLVDLKAGRCSIPLHSIPTGKNTQARPSICVDI